MEEFSMYITTPNGKPREINWIELNDLKKDILWLFDENSGDLFNAFVPRESFQNKYWEYLTLDGDKFFHEDIKDFYKQGVLIVVLCMTIEYMDTESGDQQIFEATNIDLIIQCVQNFEPRNHDQTKLKNIVASRLQIANSMTESDLTNKEYEHTNLDDFLLDLNWIDRVFIQSYFKNLMR